MNNPASLHAIVSGHVQGVAFRAFVADRASTLGVTGYVKNLPDGRVEITAEGDPAQLELLLQAAKKGPPSARVEQVIVDRPPFSGSYHSFSVK